MSGADWLILIFILVSVAEAASQGFFQVAFGMAGLIVGYIVAAWQYHRLAARFDPYLKSPWLGEIASFLIIFIAVMLLAGLVGRLARWAVREAGLSFLDRVLGGALGLVRGGLIVAVILMGMAAFTPTSKWLDSSHWAPYFLVVGRAAVWVAPSELRGRFYQGIDLLRHQQREIVPPGNPAPPAPAKPAGG